MEEENDDLCEGCGAPATCYDSEGIALCNECFQSCVDDPDCHVNDGENETERRAGAGSMQPVGRRIHTIPIGDKELHAAQETCWCHPTQTEPNIIVHNALDCREAQERATAAKASEGWVLIAEYVFPDSPTVLMSDGANEK